MKAARKFKLFHGEILLGNLNLCGPHVVTGITHDVSILIDKESIVRLNACVNIGVVGAVPLSAG